MFQTRVPASPTMYMTRYDKFSGVDFRTDPSQVDAKRSPWAPNLISDSGGKPEKRPGWRTIKRFAAGNANGLHSFVSDEVHFLAHIGNRLYRWDGDRENVISAAMNPAKKSMSMSLDGKLWIVDGLKFKVYDGQTISNASANAYVPTTVISRDPDGGGTTYEAINMLSSGRINAFLSDGESRSYQLDATGLDSTRVTAKVNGSSKTEGVDFSVNRTTGVVTFTVPPGEPPVTGADNVFITFYKTVSGYSDRVDKCSILSVYGRGNDTRLFLAGNPDFPNYDFYCAYNDPGYMPDINYSIVGSDATKIVGYRSIYGSQAILKEDNAQDYTIFLRTPDVLDNRMVFRVTDGITGVGAISPYAFCNLLNDAMFLSRGGVYAITSDDVIALERTVVHRSSFVDPRLTKEDHLDNAVAIEWRDYMIVSINGRCYVADARQKHYPRSLTNTFEYEWYYWDNIPAGAWLEHSGDLYFATDDGHVCRFNTDMVDERDPEKGLLMTAYSDDGEAIVARWSTKADDDGDFAQFKTLLKKGCGVQLKPYSRSSCKIYLRTEKDFGVMAKYDTVDIFDFADIDFERFTFNTLDTPQIISIRKKVKKYKTLQIIVESDAANEAFGIFGIIKRFTRGNLVK